MEPDTTNDKLPKKIEKSIKSIIKNEEYIDYNMKWRISTESTGYIGIIYEIEVTGSTQNGNKYTDIFIKYKVENDQLKIYSISECFVRECFIYKDISKIFEELQNEAEIPDTKRFKMAKSFDECSPSCIVLENLAKRGFKTYYKMDVVSLEYAELSVEYLARFHSLSLVLQKSRPEYFNEKIKIMKQPFIFGNEWREFVRNIANFSISCLEPDVRDGVKEFILKKVDDYGKYMNDTLGVCTMCHGDYKHNNVMAKDINGKPTEVLAIDYQLLHYGNPIFDLLYFIFNGTDQEFRSNHMIHLKNLYYDTMKNFLTHFSIDVKSVFPKEDFERQFKEKLDFGLMINTFYVPFLFASEEDGAPDVVNQSLDNIAFNVNKRFTERFRGVVDDFIQWGYL